MTNELTDRGQERRDSILDAALTVFVRDGYHATKLTDISREVKVLAGELDVAMISACQLNRGNAKDKRRPELSDLRESGALEQDCDVAILLHHPELPDGSPTGEVELIVAKNRTGRMCTVTVPWRPHYARIGGDPQ